MTKVNPWLFAALIVGISLSSRPLQAGLIVDFNANNTVADVTISGSQDYTLDNTSGNGPISIAYSENGSQAAGIRNFAGAGLRIRNQADGGMGTALFGFDLGGSFQFGTGADDDIFIRTGANLDRVDDAGTGTRVALENAGTWYVSEEIHLRGESNVNALDLDWFALGGDTIAGITNVSGTVSDASTFLDITSAGAWIEVLGVNDAGNNPNSNYGVQELQISVASVPEPASLLLFAMWVPAFALGRRRRVQ